MKDKGKTCPSAKFTKGAYLIGIKNDKDEIDMLEDSIKITDEIYKKFEEAGTKPEKTLRMANKCLESGCKQWTGEKCGVVNDVLQRVEARFLKDQLPKCAIRSTCRWYAQEESTACKVCPLVTTFTEDPKNSKFFNHDSI